MKRKLIKEVQYLTNETYKLADTKINSYGSGGMITKLEAAKICMNAGCHMFIGNGNRKNKLNDDDFFIYNHNQPTKQGAYSCFIMLRLACT